MPGLTASAALARRQFLHFALGGGAVLLGGCGGEGDGSGEGSISLVSGAEALPIVISADRSGPTTHRLYTFIENDPSIAGTADSNGYFAVREGYDYLNFPVIRTPKLTNKPTGHSFRDPSVVRDPKTGTYWMLASAHFINDGPDAADCDLYMSQPNDGIDFTHVCTIPAGLPGVIGMWAPDFLPFDGMAPLEFVVTLRLVDPKGAVAGVPHLFRSTSITNGSWELIGPLTGPGIPASTLDWNMVLVNGQWLACTVDYTAPPREQLLLLTAPDRLGPWAQSIPVPLFREQQVEAPQLFLPGNGNIGLFYDRFTNTGMQYRESSDFFKTFTGAAQIVTPRFVNMAGQTIYAPPKHGTVRLIRASS
jgi:hypothetical protein